MVDYNDDAPEQHEQVQDDAQQQPLTPSSYEDFFSDVTEGQAQPIKVEEPPSDDNWEHKYKVLKGKYDKEVPRLTREIRTLKQEKDQLLQRLSLLEQVVSETMYRQKQASAPQTVEDEDTDLAKLKEEYPEIYSAVYKMVEKKIKREVEPQLAQVHATAVQNSFYGRLNALAPEWKTLNSDPDFLDWLSQPSDEIPSKTRHQLMLSAYNEGDADTVAHFFNKYLSQIKASEGEVNMSQQKPQAEKAVAPPYKKTAQSGKASKRVFTESAIKQFYTDLALGKIPPEKREQLENQVLEAIMENRIIYGK